jgi:parallel beta-helix repeat protein
LFGVVFILLINVPTTDAEKGRPILGRTVTEWVIESGDEVVHEKENLNIGDNVTVESGGKLILRECSVVMSGKNPNVPRALRVLDGGQLVLERNHFVAHLHIDNTIHPQNPTNYRIILEGKASLNGNRFEGLWGEISGFAGPRGSYAYGYGTKGGIEIYSDDVVVEGNTITDPQQYGIYVEYSSPIVKGNRISGGWGACIVGKPIEYGTFYFGPIKASAIIKAIPGGEPLIKGNILDVEYAPFFVHTSFPKIVDNRIALREYFFSGTTFLHTSIYVFKNNTYDLGVDPTGTEALYVFNSTVVAENNTFLGFFGPNRKLFNIKDYPDSGNASRLFSINSITNLRSEKELLSAVGFEGDRSFLYLVDNLAVCVEDDEGRRVKGALITTMKNASARRPLFDEGEALWRSLEKTEFGRVNDFPWITNEEGAASGIVFHLAANRTNTSSSNPVLVLATNGDLSASQKIILFGYTEVFITIRPAEVSLWFFTSSIILAVVFTVFLTRFVQRRKND